MNSKKTDSDLLERLKRVAELVTSVGQEALGHRVRRLRKMQKMSIRDVAEKAGISKNSIVRLELGRGTQPITILKICTVLGVHVERLAEPTDEDTLAISHKAKDDRWYDVSDMGSRPLLDAKRPLTPRERKKAVELGALVPINLLNCRLPGGKVMPSILELYQPSPTRSHVGEEFVYVLDGEATVTVGKKKYKLKQGESLTFWSAEPHSYAPTSKSKIPVRILSVRVDG